MWNVQEMSQGKLDIQWEMTRLKFDLIGISERHWIDNRYFYSEEFIIYKL